MKELGQRELIEYSAAMGVASGLGMDGGTTMAKDRLSVALMKTAESSNGLWRSCNQTPCASV